MRLNTTDFDGVIHYIKVMDPAYRVDHHIKSVPTLLPSGNPVAHFMVCADAFRRDGKGREVDILDPEQVARGTSSPYGSTVEELLQMKRRTW
jgi:hypothetical protein